LHDPPPEHLAPKGGYLELTAHALRAVIGAMQVNGHERGGQILVFTSDAGARPEAGWSLYGAARAGQNFLIRAVALEHAAEGIQINALGSKNAITAGFPYAPPDAATDSAVTLGEWAEPLLAETPLPWLGTMEELAAFAISLVDGSNRFQTAQYFSFSGGWSEM
jgi:3-oxoacyl-[acyl-carrier protein] reductase